MGKKEGEPHQQQLVEGVEAERRRLAVAASPLGLNTVGVAEGGATIRDVQLEEAERLALWDVDARGLTEGWQMQPLQLVLPAEWASCYQWNAERGFFFCRLCWKNAEESHVYSERHRYRMRHPALYLDEHVQQYYREQLHRSISPSSLSDLPLSPPPPPHPPPPPETTAPIPVHSQKQDIMPPSLPPPCIIHGNRISCPPPPPYPPPQTTAPIPVHSQKQDIIAPPHPISFREFLALGHERFDRAVEAVPPYSAEAGHRQIRRQGRGHWQPDACPAAQWRWISTETAFRCILTGEMHTTIPAGVAYEELF